MALGAVSKKIFSVGALFAALFVGWIQLPDFTKNALYHLLPGIDDYKIFTNRTIKTADPQSLELSEVYNQLLLPDSSLEFLKKRKTGAFIVLQNGKMVSEYYGEGLDKDVISGSFSMAKSLTSLLVGKALEKGWITSVNDPVYKYLPQYEFAKDSTLTIYHLLTMGTGFSWKESYNNPMGWPVAAYYGNNLDEVMANVKKEIPVGTEFRYQSIVTQILGEIIRTTSGKNLSELMQEFFWQPMHMESDALWSLDHEDGREKAFCCFSATARDFAKIGQLILQKGMWNGQQLISSEYLEDGMKPAKHMVLENGRTVSHYGYQFALMNYKDYDIRYFAGHLGQFIFTIPELDAVIVRLGHENPIEFDEDGHYTESYRYIDAGLEILKQVKIL